MNQVGTAPPAVRRSEAPPLMVDAECVILSYPTTMFSIRLEPELEQKLDSLAKQTGRSKSYYARKAICQYLEEREDYLKGIATLERREPTITLEELERTLGPVPIAARKPLPPAALL